MTNRGQALKQLLARVVNNEKLAYSSGTTTLQSIIEKERGHLEMGKLAGSSLGGTFWTQIRQLIQNEPH
eukprot:scaffold9935_cov95-Skeletonema_menzelii.AAC.1